MVRCLNPEAVEGGKEGWSCKIDECFLGLVGQMWGPDSRQILTFTDLQLRASVWSLVEQKAIAHLRGPKFIPPRGIALTKNKKFAALLERRESKDWVSIYFAGADWKLVTTFEANEAFDAADLAWCREDTAILVYDTPLEAKFWVYSAMTGDCLVRQNLSLTQGPSPGALGLGIKSVSISPNGIYFAVATFDSKVRLFNGVSMREVSSLDHQSQVSQE